MKTMRRVWHFLLIMFVYAAGQAATFKQGGLMFDIEDEARMTAVVVKELKHKDTRSVPETVKFKGKIYTVTTIGEEAFKESKLDLIALPESITKISDGAFEKCSFGSGELVLPSHLESIGRNAFSQSGLKKIKLPDSVKQLGNGVFQYCSKLTEATLSDSLSRIPFEAFERCEALKSIIIPASVSVIESYAFYGCESLESIVFPSDHSSLEKIESLAFHGCKNLKSVNLFIPLSTIGNQAFAECRSLTNVVLPLSLTKIEKSAFEGCRSLKSVTGPERIRYQLKEIGTGATNFTFLENPKARFYNIPFLHAVPCRDDFDLKRGSKVREIRQRRGSLAPYFEIHAKFDHNGKTVLWETSNNIASPRSRYEFSYYPDGKVHKIIYTEGFMGPTINAEYEYFWDGDDLKEISEILNVDGGLNYRGPKTHLRFKKDYKGNIFYAYCPENPEIYAHFEKNGMIKGQYHYECEYKEGYNWATEPTSDELFLSVTLSKVPLKWSKEDRYEEPYYDSINHYKRYTWSGENNGLIKWLMPGDADKWDGEVEYKYDDHSNWIRCKFGYDKGGYDEDFEREIIYE